MLGSRTREKLLRLHSLSGALPVGVFLLQHLLINGLAIQGSGPYNRIAAALGRLPLLPWIEGLAIGVPLAFHAGLGILIAARREGDEERPLGRRRMDALQRWSGVFLAFYLVYHLWSTRFSAARWSGDPDLFALMARHLQHPGVMVFNVLGVLAAAFHFGHGLVRFAMHWNLTPSVSAQRRMGRLGIAIGALVALLGLNALFAFTHRTARWLERPAMVVHDRNVP